MKVKLRVKASKREKDWVVPAAEWSLLGLDAFPLVLRPVPSLALHRAVPADHGLNVSTCATRFEKKRN
jgi:hypothetical protein